MPNIVTPLRPNTTATFDAPCPPWCVLPADHDLDDVDPDGEVTRTHRTAEQVAGGYRLQVEQLDVLDAHGRLLEAHPPRVRLLPAEPGPEHDLLTLADGGELAAALFWTVAAIVDTEAQR